MVNISYWKVISLKRNIEWTWTSMATSSKTNLKLTVERGGAMTLGNCSYLPRIYLSLLKLLVKRIYVFLLYCAVRLCQFATWKSSRMCCTVTLLQCHSPQSLPTLVLSVSVRSTWQTVWMLGGETRRAKQRLK